MCVCLLCCSWKRRGHRFDKQSYCPVPSLCVRPSSRPIDNPCCCLCACVGEADVNQNNDHPSKRTTAVTDSTGAEGAQEVWSDASADDPNDGTPRPHLVRLFSRDAPGREDNTFKDRPSESDELQTIQEHSGAGTESGSE